MVDLATLIQQAQMQNGIQIPPISADQLQLPTQGNTAQQILSQRPIVQMTQQNQQPQNQQPPMNGIQPQQIQQPQPMSPINPSFSDLGQSAYQTQMALLQPEIFKAATPQQVAMQNLEAPQDLQAKMIANQIAIPKAQSEANLQNAQAGYYGSALQRDISEKQFEYQNNPEMMQAAAMARLLNNASGYSNSAAYPGQSADQSAAQMSGPTINRGAILQKMGLLTPGQQEEDKNFAQSWQSYNNEGGDKRLQNGIDTINDAISKLQKGEITTGGGGTRAFINPNGEPIFGSQFINPNAIVTRNLISGSILPQAKALFGARVTNFDANQLINSQGMDLMADTDTNIQKLERLRDATVAAQKELNESGNYFDQNGTLTGYQSTAPKEGTASGSANQATPTMTDISTLRANPSAAPFFDKKFGKGASQKYLGR